MKNMQFLTPLILCFLTSCLFAMEKPENPDQEAEQFLQALNEGNTKEIKKIFTNNPRINSCFNRLSFQTPLVYAVNKNNTWAARALLEIKEIHPNAAIGTSNALHVAVNSNNIDMVQLLLSHPEILINLQGGSDRLTPLEIASYFKFKQIIELLLNHQSPVAILKQELIKDLQTNNKKDSYFSLLPADLISLLKKYMQGEKGKEMLALQISHSDSTNYLSVLPGDLISLLSLYMIDLGYSISNEQIQEIMTTQKNMDPEIKALFNAALQKRKKQELPIAEQEKKKKLIMHGKTMIAVPEDYDENQNNCSIS